MANWIIDAGNSRIKFAVYERGSCISLDHFEGPEALLASWPEYPRPEGVICSNVGAWDFRELRAQAPALWLDLEPETPLPITVDYATEHTWGNDRRALAVAAASHFPGRAALVVDVGSCITGDFVDSGGTYRGGWIAPGIQMRLRSMHDYTQSLPLLEWREMGGEELPEHPAKSTRACLLTGAVRGAVTEVSATLAAYRRQYPGLVVIITGGDAETFVRRIKSTIFARPKFLLSGLNSILEYHTS